ncbi:MAG TPA: formate dehydrogenase accessory protein FdhE [Xanthobacteraceae bacterium]|nr:formate dehydrogenase accessory protein FdhE [Xanthobacteraceae bacterium]
MRKVDAPRHDPVPIGEVAAPPFCRLPDPLALFVDRTHRFRVLGAGHELGPYLRFLADLTEAQYRIQDALPEPALPDAAARSRAREFGMPPLERSRFTVDAAYEATLERLLALAATIEMPPVAAAALARVAAADAATRDAMMRALLADEVPVETLAEHVFVAAALQVHFARLAARLDADALVAVGDGVCPACGGPPVASMVVGWKGAHGTRFCGCALCGTLWNVVRIKCTLCGSTKGIGYQEIEGSGGIVKAETCDECRGYVKILHQHKQVDVDPIADDVASLGLDLKVREQGYRRGAFNPFLIGY